MLHTIFIGTKFQVMKKLYMLWVVMLFAISSFSQAYEGTIQFGKKKQTAIISEYTYPAEAVENAFIKKMEILGYKAKEEKGILNKDKGFIVFKNAYVTEITREKLDYIIKVERKSRKENDESVLYLVLQRDGENAMDKIESYDIGRAKSFLNQMLPDIEAANLELKIKAQEESIDKAEKKLKNLQDDKADLEKKLLSNEKAQDDTIRELENQRSSLETLRGRRKGQ